MSGLLVQGQVVRDDFRLDIDLEVAPGEVVCVLGPNGAGKSTLLRTLAGLVPLTTGRTTLVDRVVEDTATGVFVLPEHRPVGLVFQDYRLFPHMTVRDNVAFAPRSRRVGRHRSRELADAWLSRLDIAELAGRRPHQLSGGQAQRVALARALAREPALLLLDEPLSALDARTRVGVRAELRRHLREFAGPTLLVTHDPLEAMVMADRLVVVEGGTVVQQGTPAQVASRPTTDYVAHLVGLNLYRGHTAGSGLVHLDGGGQLVTAGPVEAGRVLVSLRPQAVGLHTTKPDHSSPRNVWEGTVTGLELLTDRVRVEVRGSPGAVVDVTPAAVAELGLVEGRRVWLSAKATDLEVYEDQPEP